MQGFIIEARRGFHMINRHEESLVIALINYFTNRTILQKYAVWPKSFACDCPLLLSFLCGSILGNLPKSISANLLVILTHPVAVKQMWMMWLDMYIFFLSKWLFVILQDYTQNTETSNNTCGYAASLTSYKVHESQKADHITAIKHSLLMCTFLVIHDVPSFLRLWPFSSQTRHF